MNNLFEEKPSTEMFLHVNKNFQVGCASRIRLSLWFEGGSQI